MDYTNWVRVFSANEEYQVKIAEDVLKQHNIESHIVKHPDHAFPSVGEAVLYTLPGKAETAVRILQESEIV